MSAARRTATVGVIAAVTLVLSYVEHLVPMSVAIPGIKPGFANIGVMVALYTLGGGYAALVSVIRVLLAGLLFASFSGVLYSLAGAAAALVVMLVLRRAGIFGAVGVSVGGAAAHIFAQLAVASALMGSVVWGYAPWMTLAAVATGAFNGIVAALVVRALPR